MKKNLFMFLGLISFLIFGLNVQAASKCEYAELSQINQEASGVKVSYEEKQRVVEGDNGVIDSPKQPEDKVYQDYFVVNITNVTDNLYVKVTNPIDNSVKVFTSADATNGIISFEWNNLDTVANLTIKVYTSSKTQCPDEEVIVKYQTLPKYNIYSDSAYCEEHQKENDCQKYVTKEISQAEFSEKVKKARVEKAEEVNEDSKGVVKKAKEYFKKNKTKVIIGGSIIIVMGVVTTVVVIIKRKRSRLI